MSGKNQQDGNKAAKILYQPFGLVSSVVAGLIAGQVFRMVWQKALPGDRGDAPKPLESEYSFKEVLVGALIQGAIFAAVKATVSRGGARVFERWTGEWPGN
ncbi:DUF4235 domain-containing protein [Occultella aeris]|uniref:DUF4235 domain-containing protein n=1 Tax=Occultella aeris TaxID=2761496 RepID=A0A7M4DG65_9MICO|nr:DUF4235 domain-containing protein [Occultella aeris]VZO35908.1 hypothetical protein HALOF300_01111 [Occultella aeris]